MIILILLLAFVISCLLTWIMLQYSIKKNILDIPNARSSHKNPTPRGGGIAIVMSFSFCLFLCSLILETDTRLIHILIVGGFLIAMIGFYDDMYSLSSKSRLTAHFLIAIFSFCFLGDLHQWDFLCKTPIILNWVCGIFGIAWCINFYNFMDGIDGLASTEGIFVASAGALALWLLGINDIAIICLCLAVTIAGFGIWNWEPAKIFMGDVGSGYLGYIFSIIGLYTIHQHYLTLNFWWILLAVFFFDTTLTLLYRFYHKKDWFNAHKEHAYQKLVLKGFTHQKTSLLILLINLGLLFPLAFIQLFILPQYSFWLTNLAFTLICVTWLIVYKSSQKEIISKIL